MLVQCPKDDGIAKEVGVRRKALLLDAFWWHIAEAAYIGDEVCNVVEDVVYKGFLRSRHSSHNSLRNPFK